MTEINNICVFGASSVTLQEVFYEDAKAFGIAMGKAGKTIIYGAGEVGIMGAVALPAKQHGAKIIGVCPQDLHDKGFTWDGCDQLILTEDIRDRKKIMDERSDVFVCLPGGFGTLDEVMETLANKQLHYHEKPIILLNTAGFFNPLLNYFEIMISGRFARDVCRDMLLTADDVEELVELINIRPAPRGKTMLYNHPDDIDLKIEFE